MKITKHIEIKVDDETTILLSKTVDGDIDMLVQYRDISRLGVIPVSGNHIVLKKLPVVPQKEDIFKGCNNHPKGYKPRKRGTPDE